MAEKEKTYTASDMYELLHARYSGPEWAFVGGVPNGTGMAKTRTADGLAMSLWPSKGLHLHGFEIKVNRSDWFKEIQDVSKAAAFSLHCHYWWIAAPAGVVKAEEMPADWGLLVPAPKGLRVKKAATFKPTPLPPSYALLAGIFRACLRSSVNEQRIRKARDEGWRQGQKYAEDSHERRASANAGMANQQHEALKKAVADFEAASGVHISAYRGRKLGEAVALIQSHGVDGIAKMLDGLLRDSRRIAEAAESAARAFRESEGDKVISLGGKCEWCGRNDPATMTVTLQHNGQTETQRLCSECLQRVRLTGDLRRIPAVPAQRPQEGREVG